MNRWKNLAGERSAAAFTLVEALVAISITAMAGSVLLLGSTVSLQNTDEALRQTVALGLAQQLMNEVVGSSSMAEIDRYDGFKSEPPLDRWGVELGTEDGKGGQRHSHFRAVDGVLDRFCREVHVAHVDPADLTTRLPLGKTSDYRLVEVRVTYDVPSGGTRELAHLKRVVAHVPPY